MPYAHASLHLPRCDEVSERLSEFLDGDLAPVEAHEVALHLAICEACAQLLVELAETVHALHGLRPDVPGIRSRATGSSQGTRNSREDSSSGQAEGRLAPE